MTSQHHKPPPNTTINHIDHGNDNAKNSGRMSGVKHPLSQDLPMPK